MIRSIHYSNNIQHLGNDQIDILKIMLLQVGRQLFKQKLAVGTNFMIILGPGVVRIDCGVGMMAKTSTL